MKKITRIMSLLICFQIFIVSIWIPQPVKADNKKQISGQISVAMQKNETMMEPYIKAFMEKYPDVTVEYSCLMDYENSITSMMQEGNEPDVFLVPSSLAYDDYEKVLEPLGNQDELSIKYNYTEKGNIKEGVVYSLPTYACVYGLIYNKEVFSQAGITSVPKDMDDFMYDCGLIKQHTEAIPLYTNYNDGWAAEYWEFFPFIEMSGKANYKYNDYIYSKNPFLRGSNHYKVYRFLYDLIQAGYTENIGQGSYGQATADLANGKIATMVMGSWAYKEIQDSAEKADNLGFMAFPNSIGGHQYSTIKTDYAYGVSANSANTEAAKAFIEFMLDESGFAVETGNISILKTDPYPDYLNDLSQVTLMIEGFPSDSDYWLLSSLQKNIVPGSEAEIKRIMEAASGKINENFDTIMNDWNTRWESGRPEFYRLKKFDYGNGEVELSNNEIFISDNEQLYINSHKNLNVGYLKNFAPFSYEIDGEPTGLAFDVCKSIEDNIGFKFNYVGFDTMHDAKQALANGSVDMLAGVVNTDAQDITYSKAFYEVLNVYISSKNVDFTMQDDQTVAVSGEELCSKFAYITNRIEEADIIQCMEAVENGTADYSISNYNTADYYIKDLEYSDMTVTPTASYATLHIAFKTGVDSSLLALINKCMYTISKEKLQVNLLTYSNPPEKAMTMKRLAESNPFFVIGIVSVISLIIIISVIILLYFVRLSNKRLSFEMDKYEMLSDLAEEYMFDYDRSKKTFHFDTKFQKSFGFDAKLSMDTYSDEDLRYKSLIEKIRKIEKDKSEQDIAFEMVMVDESTNWYKMFVSSIKDKDGKPIYVVGKVVNVQKEMEEMLYIQSKAEKDALTGLLNRHGFKLHLPLTAKNVLFIVSDLDNFKGVNDSIGHLGGDKALCVMAESLNKALGKKAIIGRYGGDEFVACIPEISIEEADERLKELVSLMDREIEYEGLTHHISISVGGFYREEETEIETMFTNADNVLYEKKKNGKNGYIISSSLL